MSRDLREAVARALLEAEDDVLPFRGRRVSQDCLLRVIGQAVRLRKVLQDAHLQLTTAAGGSCYDSQLHESVTAMRRQLSELVVELEESKAEAGAAAETAAVQLGSAAPGSTGSPLAVSRSDVAARSMGNSGPLLLPPRDTQSGALDVPGIKLLSEDCGVDELLTDWFSSPPPGGLATSHPPPLQQDALTTAHQPPHTVSQATAHQPPPFHHQPVPPQLPHRPTTSQQPTPSPVQYNHPASSPLLHHYLASRSYELPTTSTTTSNPDHCETSPSPRGENMYTPSVLPRLTPSQQQPSKSVQNKAEKVRSPSSSSGGGRKAKKRCTTEPTSMMPAEKRLRRIAAEDANNSDSSSEEDPGPYLDESSGTLIQRPKDELIQDMETALDPDNYDPIPLPAREARHAVTVPVDRKRGSPARIITWSTKPPDICPHNQLLAKSSFQLPQLSERAQQARTVAEFWQLFFTDEILDLIVIHTNEKIAENLAKGNYTIEQLRKKPYVKPVDKIELISLFGLCYLVGLHRSTYQAKRGLFRNDPMFGATMSSGRFSYLMSHLRLDNAAWRDREDKFAAAREVFDLFNAACADAVRCGSQLCLDEILFSAKYRDFTEEILSLGVPGPRKKYVPGDCFFYKSLNDASLPYTYQSQIYMGKPKTRERNDGLEMVTDLLHGYQRGGRQRLQGTNLTCDRLYMSFGLAERLLAEFSMTCTGLISHRTKGLPPHFVSPVVGTKPVPGNYEALFQMEDEGLLSVHSWTKAINEGVQNVVIATTHSPVIMGRTKDDGQKKPAIVKQYEMALESSCRLQQLIDTWRVRIKSNRWIMSPVSYMLDVARINARTVGLLKGHPMGDGELFVRELIRDLIAPQVRRRGDMSGIQQHVKNKVASFLVDNAVLGEPVTQPPAARSSGAEKRYRCRTCCATEAADLERSLAIMDVKKEPEEGESEKRRRCRACYATAADYNAKQLAKRVSTRCRLCLLPFCILHLRSVCGRCFNSGQPINDPLTTIAPMVRTKATLGRPKAPLAPTKAPPGRTKAPRGRGNSKKKVNSRGRGIHRSRICPEIGRGSWPDIKREAPDAEMMDEKPELKEHREEEEAGNSGGNNYPWICNDVDDQEEEAAAEWEDGEAGGGIQEESAAAPSLLLKQDISIKEEEELDEELEDIASREAMLMSEAAAGSSSQPRQRRGRCNMCYAAAANRTDAMRVTKSSQICLVCGKFVCKGHLVRTCFKCEVEEASAKARPITQRTDDGGEEVEEGGLLILVDDCVRCRGSRPADDHTSDSAS